MLPYVKQYKYLGVIFEQRGCSLDVKRQISVMVEEEEEEEEEEEFIWSTHVVDPGDLS